MNGRIITLDHLQKKIDFNKISLVDIRPKEVYQFGTIPGAINIPAKQARDLYDLPVDKAVYIFCQSGEISGDITERLCDAGYDAYHLPVGYLGYLKNALCEKDKKQTMNLMRSAAAKLSEAL